VESKYVPFCCSDILLVFIILVFFIGSSGIGKIIAAVAAKSLVHLTLELGGKCAVIVNSTSDITLAAKRIPQGKLHSAGQACRVVHF
jgi:aldehyde dehydrogenase (NAD+)